MYVKNITKRFGDKLVLDGFSADFPDGKASFVVGQSGCGKSTLLNIIMGLLPADSGEIDPRFSDRVSAVFQEDRLCKKLSAAANVRLVCPAADEEIIASLSEVGLAREDALRPVSELSGGMKRRAAIVRAVMAESRTVIMDEPFKGLDPSSKSRTIEYVLKNLRGRTLIAVTHDISEADAMNGKIFEIHGKTID